MTTKKRSVKQALVRRKTTKKRLSPKYKGGVGDVIIYFIILLGLIIIGFYFVGSAIPKQHINSENLAVVTIFPHQNVGAKPNIQMGYFDGVTGVPTVPPPRTSSDSDSGATGECTAPEDNQLRDQDYEDSQLPWNRNGAPKAVINFETRNVNAEFLGHMQKGVEAWNRSACLDTRLVATCPAGENCVTVTAPDPGSDDDGNFDANESGGFTTGGHIQVASGLSTGENLNVMIHEMGHAVGLRHRLTQRVLMNGDTYTDVFDPDETDFHNLQVLYGSQ